MWIKICKNGCILNKINIGTNIAIRLIKAI